MFDWSHVVVASSMVSENSGLGLIGGSHEESMSIEHRRGISKFGGFSHCSIRGLAIAVLQIASYRWQLGNVSTEVWRPTCCGCAALSFTWVFDVTPSARLLPTSTPHDSYHDGKRAEQ